MLKLNNSKKNFLLLTLFILILLLEFNILFVYAAYFTFKHQCPKNLVVGSEFLIPIHISPTYDLEDFYVNITAPSYFQFIESNNFSIKFMDADSEIGHTFRIYLNESTTPGIYYVNYHFFWKYSASSYNLIETFEVRVIEIPKITLSMNSPSEMYTGGTYDIIVDIDNSGITAYNTTVSLILPREVSFQGNKKYYLSYIEEYSKEKIVYRIKPSKISGLIHSQLMIEILYYDEIGIQKKENIVAPIILRSRNPIEFGKGGGIWVGPFYISPAISYGTIIAIIIFILNNRMKKKEDEKEITKIKYLITFLSGMVFVLFVIGLIKALS